MYIGECLCSYESWTELNLGLFGTFRSKSLKKYFTHLLILLLCHILILVSSAC